MRAGQACSREAMLTLAAERDPTCADPALRDGGLHRPVGVPPSPVAVTVTWLRSPWGR
jgi:hypothetical protein